MNRLAGAKKAAIFVEVIVAFSMPALVLLYGTLMSTMALVVGVRGLPASTIGVLLCVPLGVGGLYAVGSLLQYVTEGARPRLKAKALWALLAGGLFALAFAVPELGFAENGGLIALVLFPAVVALHLTALADDYMWSGDV